MMITSIVCHSAMDSHDVAMIIYLVSVKASCATNVAFGSIIKFELVFMINLQIYFNSSISTNVIT